MLILPHQTWLESRGTVTFIKHHIKAVDRLLGLATRAHRWERHLQANTERRRSVLSTVFLGRELLRNHRVKITPDKLAFSLQSLKSLVKIHSALA